MRARNLKPALFKNELLAVADPLYTVIFEGLWCLADREGRLEDRPGKIHLEINPGRPFESTERSLSWLHDNGFILRYQAEEGRYIQVTKFAEHQTPHHKEGPSKIPAPSASNEQKQDKPKENPGNALDKPGACPRQTHLTPDSPFLTPDSPFLNADSSAPATPVLRSAVCVVFDHWRQEWGHSGAKLDDKRRKRIEARLREGFTAEQLCQAVSGYKHSPWHTGTDPKGGGVVYDGIQTLLQDSEHVETGLRLFKQPPRPPPQENLSPGERVARAYRGNGNGRVVAEYGGESCGDLEESCGHVWPALPS